MTRASATMGTRVATTNLTFRNPEVHYCPYISWPVFPIFSKIFPISRIITLLLKYILILSSRLRLDLHKGLFPSGFPAKTMDAFLVCSIRVTIPVHLSRLDLTFIIMLGEEYNAWKLQVPTINSFWGNLHYVSTILWLVTSTNNLQYI